MPSQFGGIPVDAQPTSGSQFGGIPVQQDQPSYLQGVGNSLSGAMQSAKQFLNMGAGDQTPVLDTIRAQQASGQPIPFRERVGAFNEGFQNSPPGHALGAVFGVLGAPVTPLINSGIDKLDQAGLPREYSQALLNVSPLLLKAAPPVIRGAADYAPKGAPALSSAEQPIAPIPQVSSTPTVEPSEAAPSGVPPTLATGITDVPPLVPQKAWTAAEGILQKALAEERIKPEDIAANLETAKATGLPLTAMDVATKDVGGVQTQGRNLLGLADAAANMPGDAAAMAGDLATRGYLAKQRIGQAFDKNISGSKYYDIQNDAIQGQEGAGPLYNEAYAKNQNIQSPAIDRILQTPAGQAALKAASVKMQNDMSLMGVNDPELMEQAKLTGQYVPGSGGVASGLKLRSLDYVKRSLDDQIGAAQRAGENDNVRILSGLKGNLVKALDDADSTATDTAPGLYAKGRASYATAARVKDALDAGRNFMSMDKEQIADYLNDRNTSSPEKAAFATGVRRALQDKMGNVGDNANAITALWKDNIRDRLEPLFPSKDAYNRFAALMQHEQTMARVNGLLTRGSQTNMRGNYQEQLAPKAVPTAATIVKSIIEPQGALANKVGDMMTEALQKHAKGMSQDTAAAVMHYLRANDPQTWRALAAKLNPPPSKILTAASNAITANAPTLPSVISAAAKSAAPIASTAITQAQQALARNAANLSNLPNGANPFAAPALATPAEAGAPQALGVGAGGSSSELQPLSSAPQTPLIDREAQAESRGNPNARNPNSTASGLLQFTNGTWAQMVGKYGKQTGIDLSDKNNPEAQKIMGQLLARDNAKYLASKTGKLPTDGEIYAAHVLGAPDAVKLINSQGSGRDAITLFSRSVTAANRPIFFDGKRARSVEEVYALLNNKVQG